MPLPPQTEPIWYAREKFTAAVHSMATSDGTLKERLREALREVNVIKAKDLPEDLRDDYASLMKLVTYAEDTSGAGKIPATFLVITNSEVHRAAQLIADLQSGITWRLFRAASG